MTEVELSSAGEVSREERQHEDTDVPQQPRRLVVGEAGGAARDLDRNRRSHGEGERLEPAGWLSRRLFVPSHEELLPEPAAVLARELAGQAIDIPQPLHGDQEPLIGREAGRAQLGDLVAKMILQLIDVATVDARSTGDIGPPLCDL